MAASRLMFDGRVALITGAGGGLGKEYALLLASRGAKVVVNDLGGNFHGEGKATKAADEVVATIRANGGVAVPNYDSVEEGDKVVKTAIDNFGRIDILINNAGILRDRSLIKMTDRDWDLVHTVHLRGSFKVTRAAFPYMKQQEYGRVIMTSSPAGLYGNFGQSNYSAAKMGLVGLSSTVAKEGAKYNIYCNTVAPQAWSRMTADLYPPELENILTCADIAPVVTYLCHDSCKDSGSIIETLGGFVAKIRLQQSEGVILKRPFTVEDIRDNWSKICDMSNPNYPTGGQEVTGRLLSSLQPTDESATVGGESEQSIVDKVIETPPYKFDKRDIILYALGVGCTISQTDYSNLKYLYEGHPEFSVIPSFAVLPAMNSVMGRAFIGGIKGLKDFSMAQALHGEQYVELKRPFPTEGTLYSTGKVVDILDKKSGALIIINTETKTEDGELIAINQFSTFIIGVGGFGGKTSSDTIKPIVNPPSRAPDASLQHKTLPSQATLYRLSGDYNPLHIDPEFAKLGGFSTPILHGMCSYGIATRHILRAYCNDDVSRVKAIKARFSKPVLPGHTIQTDMWKEGDRVHFVCKVVETREVCLSGGYIDLHPASSGSAVIAGPTANADLKSTAIFEQLKQHLSSAPELVKKVKAVFLWNITKNGKRVAQWTTDLKNPPGAIYLGEPKEEKAGCTLTLSDDDYVDMVSGKLNAQEAFFQGRLKLSGNVMLSQRLASIFPSNQSKL